jgi:hypothetical protein
VGFYLNAAFWFLVGAVPAAYYLPRISEFQARRVALFFLVVGAGGLLIRSVEVFFLFFGIAVLGFAGTKKLGILYPAFLFAVPSGVSYRIPFPGLNYLVDLNPNVLLSLVAIPAILAGREKTPRNSIGTIILIWSTVECVLIARGTNQTATNILRYASISLLENYVPFLLVAKYISHSAAFRACIHYFGVAALLIAAIGIWFKLRGWDIYTAIVGRGGGGMMSRGGVLRSGVTVPAVLYGYLAILGGAVLLAYRKLQAKRSLLLVWVGISIAALFFSTSRGAIFALIIWSGSFYVYTRENRAQRNTLYIMTAIASFFIISASAALDFSAIDPYGTFAYRQLLIEVSLVQFFEHPLFGQVDYIETERFDVLLQGQGIVDIVNSFIAVGLMFGLAGLVPFVLLFILPIQMVLKTSRTIPEDALGEGLNARQIGHGLAATITGYAALLMTVSMVSYIQTLIFIFAAFAVAYRQVGRNAELAERT